MGRQRPHPRSPGTVDAHPVRGPGRVPVRPAGRSAHRRRGRQPAGAGLQLRGQRRQLLRRRHQLALRPRSGGAVPLAEDRLLSRSRGRRLRLPARVPGELPRRRPLRGRAAPGGSPHPPRAQRRVLGHGRQRPSRLRHRLDPRRHAPVQSQDQAQLLGRRHRAAHVHLQLRGAHGGSSAAAPGRAPDRLRQAGRHGLCGAVAAHRRSRAHAAPGAAPAGHARTRTRPPPQGGHS